MIFYAKMHSRGFDFLINVINLIYKPNKNKKLWMLLQLN